MKYKYVVIGILFLSSQQALCSGQEDAARAAAEARRSAGPYAPLDQSWYDEPSYEEDGLVDALTSVSNTIYEGLSYFTRSLWPVSTFDEQEETLNPQPSTIAVVEIQPATISEEYPNVQQSSPKVETEEKVEIPGKTDHTYDEQEFIQYLNSLNKDIRTLDLSGCTYPAKTLIEFLGMRKLPLLFNLKLSRNQLDYKDVPQLLEAFICNNKNRRLVLWMSPQDSDDVIFNAVMLGRLMRYADHYNHLSVLIEDSLLLPLGFETHNRVHINKGSKLIPHDEGLAIIESIRNKIPITIKRELASGDIIEIDIE